jgi:hypothetical protein
MTKDDIIRMAGEVDPVTKMLLNKGHAQKMNHETFLWFLERFAKLVAAAERESCANLCEDTNQEYEPFTGQPRNLSYTCADAIRARGTT